MFTSSSIPFHAPTIHHSLSSTTTHSFSFLPHNNNLTLHLRTPSFLRPPPLNPSLPSIFTVSAKSSTPDKASEQKWVHEGLITESLPNGMFRVRLDNEDLILGYISGRIRKNFVRILPGDRVRVEVSRYDSSKGRIVYRIRNTPGMRLHVSWSINLSRSVIGKILLTLTGSSSKVLNLQPDLPAVK